MAKKNHGKFHLPNIDVQGRVVSFREGIHGDFRPPRSRNFNESRFPRYNVKNLKRRKNMAGFTHMPLPTSYGTYG